jgi:aminoglycoside phosphotransferase family enzyme/predicted kinase
MEPSTCADPATLRRSLGPDVELRETHGSWVFLTADRAAKLKKPLRFDFADLRPAQARVAACREEVRATRETAPGLHGEVRAVVPDGDGYALAPDGTPGAIDAVVTMRRFDEERTLAARLAAGTAGPEELHRVGRAVAAFHAGARRRRHEIDVRTRLDQNLEGLAPLARGVVAPGDLLALRRGTEAWVLAWEDELAARERSGLVIDGHGDLRCEHVLLQDGVAFVDRLEHPGMRAVDVADDLAFLVADLEHLGAGELAAPLVGGYVAGGGPAPPPGLLLGFAAFRSLVRAKVALVRAAQDGDGPAPALELLALARRQAWRARGPLTVVVCGPPASGKSTLALALGELAGVPVLSADRIRDPGMGYGQDARVAILRRLGALAREAGSSVVDTTFGTPELRAAFLGTLGGGPAVAVCCLAEPEVLLARARARTPETAHGSEAGPDVAGALAAVWTVPRELDAADRLLVDGTGPVDAVADVVAAWLDRRQAAGS